MPFKPSLALTVVLLLLAILFLRLGWWQLERKADKTLLFEQFKQAPQLAIGEALERGETFARVEARGRYDPVRHILLDNKILNGRAGVHVLSPFVLSDGRVILVNRGWLPLPPDRHPLPDVATDGNARTITGILSRPPAIGPRLGAADVLEPDRWPQLVTYPDLETVAVALDTGLQPWLIRLDAADETGFQDRDWRPAVMGPEVHGAYALQWFSLAVTAGVIWLVLGLRRARSSPAERRFTE
jgi:surfeit locus 1 family protein